MTLICRHPFNSIQIQNTGEVYCCCCYWTDFYSLGNIFEQSFDEIWNGEKAQRLRKQFLENKFDICKLDICDPSLLDIEASLITDYPKFIEFSYDRNCNVRCIFCRSPKNREEEEFNRKKEKKIIENFDRVFTPILKNVEIVELNSAGELFASKHSLDVVKKIIKINPKVKFNIISNGILFSKEKIKELDIKSRLNSITISIHAATQKTYNKIVENGDFNAVIKNIEYLAQLKKEGLINNLQLNFVITSINYKEMVNFVKYTKKIGAKAFFINYHRQIDSDELEKELDITLSSNKKYNDFINSLENPIFKSEDCIISDYIMSLKPTRKTLKRHLLDLFKKFTFI